MTTQSVPQPLKTILIGCGRMGGNQAKIIKSLSEFQLTAVCDVVKASADALAEKMGVRGYGDPAEALSAEKPHIVAICSTNTTHAPLTIQAARTPGVLGVYCEKPMAHCMADARTMVQTCRENNVALVINHQRRIGPDLIEARRLMESGALGAVRTINARCAGDFLSDGTHAVDSALWLCGDVPVLWVLAQVHRDVEARAAALAKDAKAPAGPVGVRYGHPTENGAIAAVELSNGIRVNFVTGDMVEKNRAYQDYEIIGTHGRLWRTGDSANPNLYIQDNGGGTHSTAVDGWFLRPMPSADNAPGQWRPVPLPESPAEAPAGISGGYQRLVRLLRDGTPHPMAGENALRGFEVVMAVYESARLGRKIAMPLKQDRFPLELMIEEGRA